MKFELGQVVSTCGIANTMEEHPDFRSEVMKIMLRYMEGDWGDTCEEDKPLNDKEMAALMGIADKMLSVGTVPCTACHYCVSHCPMGLDIPNLISLYNEHIYTGGGFIAPMALSALPDDKKPQACLHCRSCEQVCPQQIKISEIMGDFAARLG